MNIVHPTKMSHDLPPIDTINGPSLCCVDQFGSLGSDSTDISSLSSSDSLLSLAKLRYPWVDDASTQITTPVPNPQQPVPVQGVPVAPCADGSLPPTDIEDPTLEQQGVHPGPPWFQYHDLPKHGPIIVEIMGCAVELPFLQYFESNRQVLQLGTEGQGRQIYKHHPISVANPPDAGWEESLEGELEKLVENPTFNLPLQLALDFIRDPRIMADITHLCYMAVMMPVLTSCMNQFQTILQPVMAMQTHLNASSDQFLKNLCEVKQCLLVAHVPAKVKQVLAVLANNCMIIGEHYWPGMPRYTEHLGHYRHRMCYWVFQDWLHPEGSSLPLRTCIPDPLPDHAATQREHTQKVIEKCRCKHVCWWCKQVSHFNKDCHLPHGLCNNKCNIPANHKFFKNSYCSFMALGLNRKKGKKTRGILNKCDHC